MYIDIFTLTHLMASGVTLNSIQCSSLQSSSMFVIWALLCFDLAGLLTFRDIYSEDDWYKQMIIER